MSKLIVFLGNPGVQFKRSRHNVGWMVCDRVTELCSQIGNWQSKFHGFYTKVFDTVLLKPQTFMNESGISVQEACRFYGIISKDVLVVHDDIELPFGTMKMQFGGGMGGHNGLRSIKKHLGTESFCRLRVGVGRPPANIQVADYVLGRFSPLEEAQMQDVLEKAARDILKEMGF